MHTMLSLKTGASPGRGRWDATPCGRVEGEGAVIAPAAADATDWARGCWALSTTRDASRAAIITCSQSSSNQHRRASRRRIMWLTSSSAGGARDATYAKSKGPRWATRSREPWRWRSAERGEPRCRRWCPVESGGGQPVALPRAWRELASRRPRVRWGIFRLLLCANRRVGSLGWCVRVVGW